MQICVTQSALDTSNTVVSVMAVTEQTVFRKSIKKFMLGGKQLQHSAPCQITVLFRG